MNHKRSIRNLFRKYMCLFIETIQLNEGKLQDLEYHQDRVNRTLSHFFPQAQPHKLKEIFQELSLPEKGKYRCTLSYNFKIHSLKITEYEPREIEYLRIVNDEGIDYSWKFANRDRLNSHLEKLSDNEEIIIIKKGLVTDTSYTNLVFYDNKSWYTPSGSLLRGTKRQKLLDEGKIFERDINVHDLKKFSKCSLINAMLDIGDIEISIERIIS